jgi:ParB/RepB/Spo0J family partition protein
MSLAEFAMLPIEHVRESPSNPRQQFGDLSELIASVKEKGILSPVCVRPAGEQEYELVFGARRLRAAKAAGLYEIPATIRELGDLEVLELQLVENLQRADVHPMFEALGYLRLHEQHGKTVDEIADRVGKSKAYIYARLKLCALGEAAREAFLEDRLNPSVALYLARIPDAKLQVKATKDVLECHGRPMSAREAADHIQREYVLRLDQAPFDVTDAELLPRAGACEACPKRTGNQRELFADVERADVCTDPICYREKVDAKWKRRCADAELRGDQVLSTKQAKEVFPNDYSTQPTHGSGFVDLDQRCYDDPKSRTYRKLLGRKSLPPLVLARDLAGGIHELLPKKELGKALKAAGVELHKEHAPASPEERAEQERQREEAKRRKETEDVRERAWPRIAAALVAAVEKREPDKGFWLTMARSTLDYDSEEATLNRRDVESVEALPLDKMSEGQLRALAFELFVVGAQRDAYVNLGDTRETKRLCDLYKVDLKALEKVAAKGEEPKVPAAIAGKECPGCGAKPGDSCKNYKGKNCAPHRDRPDGTAPGAAAAGSDCPICGSRPGNPCKNQKGNPCAPHNSRAKDTLPKKAARG